MTDEQRLMAIALARCVFVPGIATKRFARDMAFRAGLADAGPLTEKQDRYLREAVHKFRRQIDPSIVALANRPDDKA